MPNIDYRIIIETSVRRTQNINPKYDLREGQNDGTAGVTGVDIATAGIAAKTGKDLLDFGRNSIEMFTGNSVAQRQINDLFSAGAWVGAFIANPIAASAAFGVSVFTRGITARYETIFMNKEAERLRRYSGNYLSTTER